MTFRTSLNRTVDFKPFFIPLLFLVVMPLGAMGSGESSEAAVPENFPGLVWGGVQPGSGPSKILDRYLPAFEKILADVLSPLMVPGGTSHALPLRTRLHWMPDPGVFLAEFLLGDDQPVSCYGLVFKKVKYSGEACRLFFGTLVRETALSIPDNRKKPERPGDLLILIDPGHGGKDPGTGSCSGKYEIWYNNLLAADIGTSLEEYGFRIAYTKKTTSDLFLDLPDRERIAFESGADFVISVHHDDSPDSGKSGFSVYYSDYRPLEDRNGISACVNGGKVIYLTEEIIDNRTHMFFLNADGKPDYVTSRTPDWHVVDATPNDRAVESRKAAESVHREWKKAGILESAYGKALSADYYMTRRIPCPGILIEGGFLSNRDDETVAADPVKRKKTADSIAAGLYRFYFP